MSRGLVALAIALHAARAVAAAPSGSYCAKDVMGEVKVTIVDGSHADMTHTGPFGIKRSCDKEPYQLLADGTVQLTGLGNKDDCVAKGFKEFKQDPTGLKLSYDAKSNEFSASVKGQSPVSLSPSKCAALLEAQEAAAELLTAAAPSGSYCAKDAVGEIKVTIVDGSHADVIGKGPFGIKKSCDKEPYQLLADGTVKLTGLGNKDDCVTKGFKEFEQDPTGLKLSYDSKSNEISASVKGQSPISLSPSKCAALMLEAKEYAAELLV